MKVTNLGAALAKRLGRAPKTSSLAGAAILAGGMMFSGAAQADTLYSEDFNGVALGPFVSRTGGDGTDFSVDLPAGWARDNTTTPAPAVDAPEYFGFQVLDADAWVAEAGQDRHLFTKGGVGAHGQVLVADPDQFDDQTAIEPDLFNVFASTPSISLAGIVPASVAVNFDSSFRPYDGMTGLVDVSFDAGATWTNLLTLNRDNSGGDSSLSRADESISLPVDVQGDDMLVRFGMVDGGNDWWWAVDNVSVTGNPVPEPSSAAIAVLAAAGVGAYGRRRRK